MASKPKHVTQSWYEFFDFRHVSAMLAAIVAAVAMALPVSAKEVSGQIVAQAKLSQTTIQDTAGVQLNLDFQIPNNMVHAGDTSTLTWPDGYVSYTSETFNVSTNDGGVLAVGTCTRGNAKVTFTFTDYVDTHSNIAGHVTLTFMVDEQHKPVEGKHPFTIQIDGQTVPCGDIDYVAASADNSTEKFSKYGWQLPNTKSTIQYAMRINGAGIPTMNNLVVTDTLGTPATSYIRSSFQVKKGHFVIDSAGQFKLDGETDVTSQYPAPQFSADGRSFTMDLGNLTDGAGLFVLYQMQANYTPTNGEVFKNSAVATYNTDERIPYSWTVTWQSASGSAIGYNYAIDLSKSGEDGTVLAGAKFTVTRDRTGAVVGTVTTDEHGNASVGNLLADDYTVTEIEAPEGYELASPVKVTATDLQNAPDRAFAVHVTDGKTPTKPAEPTTPTIPMEPTEPTTPREPAKPVMPTGPTQPTQPNGPAQPTESTKPVTPTETTRSAPTASRSATVVKSPLSKTGVNIATVTALALALVVFDGILSLIALRKRAE